MAEEQKSQSWWQTLPGILTALGGSITAIAALIVALNQAGLFKREEQPVPVTPPESLAKMSTSNPVATAYPPQIQHDVPVMNPTGSTGNGMMIRLPGSLTNASGKTLQVVVRFSLQNGSPLFANSQERTFRDAQGLVATGTALIQIASPYIDLNSLLISIPYYALNLAETGLFYDLQLTAFVYVDNVALAQSSAPFRVRW